LSKNVLFLAALFVVLGVGLACTVTSKEKKG
jgi:hypothetical protein